MRFSAIFLCLVIGAVFAVVPDLGAIKKRARNGEINLDQIRRSQPVNDEDIARLLKVDYSFRTESLIYDLLENKENAESTILAGNFSFETLHHDTEGGMLARFTLTKCTTDNCGNPPPVYVAFRQGGNNILDVLVNFDESEEKVATWNFLFAIINTIYTPAEYGEGDTQYVNTVYGRCQLDFGRPEDKRFRRIIDNCEVGKGLNFSRFEGLETVNYHQDAWYTQNTKVDADIVMIDAIESLTFRSPFHEKYGFQLESRTHVEITNRTRVFIKRICSQELESTKCAEKEYGAQIVGHRKYEKVRIGSGSEKNNRLSEEINKYREHLADMGDSHICEKHSMFYANIMQEARGAKKEDWVEIMKNPENEHVLAIIGNVLGGVGTVESLEIAKEIYLIEAADHLDDLLFGIAHSTSNNEKWHKQLMYWWASLPPKSQEYWKVANTIASVLRKRCEHSTSSLNSCNKKKEKIVEKFINDLKTDGMDVKVFEVLENLPIFSSFELARDLICSKNGLEIVEKAALRVILRADQGFYDSQLTKKLIGLFRNTCPMETSTTNSQIAIEILLKCVPDHQNVATLILRTESLQNENNAEKWNYLYKAIEASGKKDELKEAFWTKMRQFKIFRPKWLNRAIFADSHVHWRNIAEAAGFEMYAESTTEFEAKMFQRSTFDLVLKKSKRENNLFSLTIDTANLDSYVKSKKEDQEDQEKVAEANIRLGLFGHKLPTYNIFKGNGDLISAVWNADGRTIKAFEGHVPLRDTRFSFPLLSGLSVDVRSSGAISTRINVAAEVSLWNQKSETDVDAFVSASLQTHANLVFGTRPTNFVTSSISALSTFSTDTNVAFSSTPYEFCLKSSQDSIKITQTTFNDNKKGINRKRNFAPKTYRLDDIVTNQCNRHAREL